MRISLPGWPAVSALALATLAFGANAAAPDLPMATPLVARVPAAADTPYPGIIALDIDASDVIRGVFRVTERIPLAPGASELTLLFPEWLPGNHSPSGPINLIGDLSFLVDGKPVAWRRDPIDVRAFHVALPAGADALTVKLIHTAPLVPDQGRVTMTQEMLNLQWEKMSLYPAGHYVRRIRVRPSVAFPPGWTVATSLPAMKDAGGGRVTWAETDYETLVDSPIFAGVNFRRWDLGHQVTLNAVADAPDELALRPQDLAALRALVDEALHTFGTPAFDRYDFLVALTDRMGGIGLEHQRSSENQLNPRTFVDWDKNGWDRNVLAHEFTHSWNGKFRRPAGLWTPDYREPMQDDLLWVYEGQTQFWGYVLAARSGLQPKQMVLDMLARNAGALSEQAGRDWRPVADTTFDPIIGARRPRPFASLTRTEDYYIEGAMVWLEADQIIRAGTGGARGLDDFARLFFTHPAGATRQKTYTRDDVIAALNAVHPYSWASFIEQRIDRAGLPAPTAGIEQAGYRLVWKDEPNAYDKARMDHDKSLSLAHSLGVTIDADGKVTACNWGSPAFTAGIVTGARIVAVDTISYTPDELKRAIAAARGGRQPIALLVKRNGHFQTIAVDYHGGLRWPWLERSGTGEAGLDRLLAPRRSAGG